MDKDDLKIGQVARLAEVNVETVRYYERRGLIPEPPRRESGYRQYPSETVRRILFIKLAQALGFTLKEIAELLSLASDDTARCSDVRSLAESKLTDIDDKIEHLSRLRSVLADLVATCSDDGPRDTCPILEALTSKEES